MLKRIYVDNFKCLVNFELTVGNINLFLGPNGAGKSVVFEVLRTLVNFVGGVSRVTDLFNFEDRTRWQNLPTQTFELDIERENDTYRYELMIEHLKEGLKTRVKHERLWFNRKPLLRFDDGDVHLYRDDHSEGPTYPFDWSQSAVASIYPRHDNTLMTWFKERLARFIIAQIIPSMMDEGSSQENPQPSIYLENYVSWYRYLSRDQGLAYKLTDDLRAILPEFDSFKFEPAGPRHRLLKVYFQSSDTQSPIGYSLDELSDGQRMLIALHTLLQVARTDQECKYTLCLDEPENFVALPEIQPWLVSLYDLCAEGKAQALLISHHPELINYLLASPVGYWFDRQGNTPTRVKPITVEGNGVSASELVARGWLS
jgi:predicted ATPase